MLGTDTLTISARMDDLVRRRLWVRHVDIVEVPDGSFDARYAFLHALYQQVFYQRLTLSQRVQMHRRAAKWTEGLRASGQIVAPIELASHHERGHQPLAAMKYYAEAANAAIVHFAPTEARSLAITGLNLLSRCPETTERMEAELALAHNRGLACAQLQGIGAAETLAAFERAQALCDVLPESPQRAVLLNGLGLTRFVMGDFARASAIADRVQKLGEQFDAPVLPMCASHLQGMVHAIRAEHPAARAELEKGIAICEELGDRIPFQLFVVDPLVSLRAHLAVVLTYLGYSDLARRHNAQASERATQVGQPIARMLSLLTTAMVEARLGEEKNVATAAEALAKVVEQNMLIQGSGPARWLRGWVEARGGSPLEGFKLIREGFDGVARSGMYAGCTETLCFAAEALLFAGDVDGAERQLDQAMELVQRLGERVELPHVLMLYASVAKVRGDFAEARRYLESALEQAALSDSRYSQVLGWTAICELADASAADFKALGSALEALPEGHSSAFAQRAARVLATRA